MRILFALDSFRPNIDGVAISIERQASMLAGWGNDIAIVAPAQRMNTYEEWQSGMHIFRVRATSVASPRWRFPIMPGPEVAKILERFCPEVVVVSVPFALSVSVARATKKRGIPMVAIPGTMPEWFLSNFKMLRPVQGVVYPKLWRSLSAFYNLCNAVVGVTPTALDFLRTHGLNRPGFVISNGVQLNSFRQRPRDEALAARFGIPNKPTVLYTGRLDAEKDMETWVKAIPGVLDRIDAHFVIGGEGSERTRLEESVEKLGVMDHTTFTGFLSKEDYERVYSLASVFAISSPAELQSLVTLEAAASGLPIVAVNAGALPELVHDGQNGYLFPLEDSATMAEKIAAILDDPELQRKMGEASRKVAEKHDIEVTSREFERLYLSLRDGSLTADEFSYLPAAS